MTWGHWLAGAGLAANTAAGVWWATSDDPFDSASCLLAPVFLCSLFGIFAVLDSAHKAWHLAFARIVAGLSFVVLVVLSISGVAQLASLGGGVILMAVIAGFLGYFIVRGFFVGISWRGSDDKAVAKFAATGGGYAAGFAAIVSALSEAKRNFNGVFASEYIAELCFIGSIATMIGGIHLVRVAYQRKPLDEALAFAKAARS